MFVELFSNLEYNNNRSTTTSTTSLTQYVRSLAEIGTPAEAYYVFHIHTHNHMRDDKLFLLPQSKKRANCAQIFTFLVSFFFDDGFFFHFICSRCPFYPNLPHLYFTGFFFMRAYHLSLGKHTNHICSLVRDQIIPYMRCVQFCSSGYTFSGVFSLSLFILILFLTLFVWALSQERTKQTLVFYYDSQKPKNVFKLFECFLYTLCSWNRSDICVVFPSLFFVVVPSFAATIHMLSLPGLFAVSFENSIKYEFWFNAFNPSSNSHRKSHKAMGCDWV